MVEHSDWMHIQEELEGAEKARAEGYEGRARVCARRAAGFAVSVFARTHGYDIPGSSAYDRLRYLRDFPEAAPEWRTAAEQLLMRVTPEHTLPIEADLIAVSRWLISQLLD